MPGPGLVCGFRAATLPVDWIYMTGGFRSLQNEYSECSLALSLALSHTHSPCKHVDSRERCGLVGQMTLSWSSAGTLHFPARRQHSTNCQLPTPVRGSRQKLRLAWQSQTLGKKFQSQHTLRASCGMPGWHRREVTAPSKAAATVLPQKIAV